MKCIKYYFPRLIIFAVAWVAVWIFVAESCPVWNVFPDSLDCQYALVPPFYSIPIMLVMFFTMYKTLESFVLKIKYKALQIVIFLFIFLFSIPISFAIGILQLNIIS